MLGHQQGEVGVVGVHLGIFVAVTVDGDDAVGVLIDHCALGIHAEGAHLILILAGLIHDLALVQLVGNGSKDLGGQLHADTDVHAVGAGGDVEIAAHALHPLAAAAAYGDDALLTGELTLCRLGDIAAVGLFQRAHRGVEIEVDVILQVVIQVLEDSIVNICAQMTDRCIQQVEIVLQALTLELAPCGGVEASALAAVCHVDLVHIVHQLQRLVLADVLIESAAELVGDVIFTVGESACTAKAVHNGAGLALDAGLDLHAVDGALALMEGIARLKDGHLPLGLQLLQLIGGENTAGAGTDNHDIILFHFHSISFYFQRHRKLYQPSLLLVSKISQPALRSAAATSSARSSIMPEVRK